MSCLHTLTVCKRECLPTSGPSSRPTGTFSVVPQCLQNEAWTPRGIWEPAGLDLCPCSHSSPALKFQGTLSTWSVHHYLPILAHSSVNKHMLRLEEPQVPPMLPPPAFWPNRRSLRCHTCSGPLAHAGPSACLLQADTCFPPGPQYTASHPRPHQRASPSLPCSVLLHTCSVFKGRTRSGVTRSLGPHTA